MLSIVANVLKLEPERTTIGFGSKSQGEEKVHGAPLGDADIAQVKAKFGFNPEEKFVVPQEVVSFFLRGMPQTFLQVVH